MMNEIKKTLVEFVKEANRNVVINSDEDFTRSLTDIGMDSLDLMTVLFHAQDKYDIEIPDEDVEKFTNLNLLAEYIKEKRDGSLNK